MCKFVYYDGENTNIKLGNACIICRIAYQITIMIAYKLERTFFFFGFYDFIVCLCLRVYLLAMCVCVAAPWVIWIEQTFSESFPQFAWFPFFTYVPALTQFTSHSFRIIYGARFFLSRPFGFVNLSFANAFFVCSFIASVKASCVQCAPSFFHSASISVSLFLNFHNFSALFADSHIYNRSSRINPMNISSNIIIHLAF